MTTENFAGNIQKLAEEQEQLAKFAKMLAGQSQELAAIVAAFTTRALRAVLPQRQDEQARKLSQ